VGSSETGGARKYLTFRAARQDYAIDAGFVRAILPWSELVPLIPSDQADPCMVGFSSLRGHVFAVYDLGRRLGEPRATLGRTPCVVAIEIAGRPGPRLIGFTVDGVSDVVQVRTRDFRRGKIYAGGRPRRVVDPVAIFAEAEPLPLGSSPG
jgi:chemotaxis signal transduction protein